MRKSILFLAFCSISCAQMAAQQAGDRLFDTGFIHEIRVESSANNFFDLLVSTWSANVDANIYLPAAVRIDGVLVDSVGVRIKGGISAFSNKRPLKIDFNKYVSGQEFDGIKKLNLNNGYLDPALQRDVLGYHIFRQAGVRAPRTAYAKVYVNNAYHGVYALIEQVDKTFLHNLFADDIGTLYANKDCNFVVDSGEDTVGYYAEMVNIANTHSGDAFVEAIEQVLDTDAFLRFFLIENFINAKDNPIDLGCNHYLYHELGSGRLHWIPWDLNFAFYNGTPYPLLFTGSYDVVYKKMLQTPVYRQRYLTLACEMLDYLFVSAALHGFIDQQAQLIRAEIAADPRYLYAPNQFESDVLSLKAFVGSRRQAFQAGLAAESFACQPFESPVPSLGLSINELVASNDSMSGIADPAGGYADWIELHNNTNGTVSLNGFYLSNDHDFKKKWAFPADASIGPNGYLIVWADRDIEESGLHCNFKLDKTGGELFLTHESLAIIDSVYFGPQTTNVAFARVPDGTGWFVTQGATFGGNNAPMSSAEQPELSLSFKVYPNPATRTLFVETGENALPMYVKLLNPLGQTILEQEHNTGACALKVQGMAPGLYFVSVAQGNKIKVKQILIGLK